MKFLAVVAVVALVLLINAVVATALFSCKNKGERRETAVTVLRILSVWILLFWLHG